MAERKEFVKGKDEKKRGSVLVRQSPRLFVKLTVSAFLTLFPFAPKQTLRKSDGLKSRNKLLSSARRGITRTNG